MYTSFTIENFRCFEKLTIEPLARVNLICGENNTGKTALLESLWMHSGPNSPDLGLRLNNFRGITGVDPRRLLHDLFRNFDPQRIITLVLQRRFLNLVGFWPEIASLKARPQSCQARGQVAMKR